jgi:hypothetical protein
MFGGARLKHAVIDDPSPRHPIKVQTQVSLAECARGSGLKIAEGSNVWPECLQQVADLSLNIKSTDKVT